MVYLLQKKYSVEYDTAVNCHQNRILTITADGQADEPCNHSNHCTSGGDNDQKCPSTHLLCNSDPCEVKSPISHGDNPSCLSDGHPTELTIVLPSLPTHLFFLLLERGVNHVHRSGGESGQREK